MGNKFKYKIKQFITINENQEINEKEGIKWILVNF